MLVISVVARAYKWRFHSITSNSEFQKILLWLLKFFPDVIIFPACCIVGEGGSSFILSQRYKIFLSTVPLVVTSKRREKWCLV